ncbi:MAG: hypothetical protein U0791_04605 [Gemmataceae bacterium]
MPKLLNADIAAFNPPLAAVDQQHIRKHGLLPAAAGGGGLPTAHHLKSSTPCTVLILKRRYPGLNAGQSKNDTSDATVSVPLIWAMSMPDARGMPSPGRALAAIPEAFFGSMGTPRPCRGPRRRGGRGSGVLRFRPATAGPSKFKSAPAASISFSMRRISFDFFPSRMNTSFLTLFAVLVTAHAEVARGAAADAVQQARANHFHRLSSLLMSRAGAELEDALTLSRLQALVA